MAAEVSTPPPTSERGPEPTQSTSSDTTSSTPASSALNLKVVHRVTSLPLVTTAVAAYDKAKTTSPLVARGFGAAEAAMRLAMAGAAPILNQFERPLGYVDRVACQGLDVLEYQVPVIKQDPAELLNMTKEYLEQWRGYGEQKVQGSLGKVSGGLVFGINQMDLGIEIADFIVEKVLPPVEEKIPAIPTQGFEAPSAAEPEVKSASDRGREVVRHAVVLGEKVKFRLTRRAVIKIGEIRDVTKAILDSITHALESVTEEAKLKVRRGSDAIRQFKGPNGMSFEKLPLSIRNMAQNLLDSVNQMIDLVQRFIPNLGQNQFLDKIKEYASELYARTTSSSLVTNGIQKCKDLVSGLQNMLNSFFSTILNPSSWKKIMPSSGGASIEQREMSTMTSGSSSEGSREESSQQDDENPESTPRDDNSQSTQEGTSE